MSERVRWSTVDTWAGLRLGPLPAAVAFAAGIVAGDRIGGSWAWAAAAACGGAAIAVRGRASRRARLAMRALALVAIAAAGVARGAPVERVVPAGAIADDRGVDRVVGRVHGPIVRTVHGSGARLDTDDGASIWVWADRELVPGERIAALGRLRTPRGLLDPGAPSRELLAESRGTQWELSARTIEPVPGGDAPDLLDVAWRWAASTQADAAAKIRGADGDPEALAALAGIAVGDRAEVSPALDQRWRAIGIFHVLSVSGLHLAVVAGLAFALLRKLVAASPLGARSQPARWAAPIALVLAVAFTLVTGAQLATLRALAVTALMLIAAALDRPLRLVDALAVAAIALLAWRPADVGDPSFQLSFVAALTLALLARRARAPVPAHRLARIAVRGWRGIVASAWVALTTAPITALHFQQVAAGGVVGNLVLTPLVELIALPLALAGAALPHGELWIRAGAAIVGAVDAAAGQLARVVPVGQIAVATPLAMAILVALSLALVARGRRRRVVDVALWAALCVGWALARHAPPDGALRATFLDVGQGDAALIELPDGAVWLIDAGGDPSAQDAQAASATGRAITATLAVYGHDHIDLAIISHPHPDHYLGLLAIGAPIRELWAAVDDRDAPSPASAAAPSSQPSFADVCAILAARATRIARPPLGVARAEAGVELIAWAPRLAATDGAPPVLAPDSVRSVNDNSLVVEVRYRGRALLFAGDVEAEGEQVLVDAGVGHVDVVKVPHHGSPTSSTAALIAATRPALAVISCGVGNRFGFPSPDVVARWRAAGADVARTDLAGAIAVLIDADGAMTIDARAPDAIGGFLF